MKTVQQEVGIVPFGVDFKNPNFARVAEAMGVAGIRKLHLPSHGWRAVTIGAERDVAHEVTPFS